MTVILNVILFGLELIAKTMFWFFWSLGVLMCKALSKAL
jgi:hypothetical protein